MSRPGRAAVLAFILGVCLTLLFFQIKKLRGDRDDDDRAA